MQGTLCIQFIILKFKNNKLLKINILSLELEVNSLEREFQIENQDLEDRILIWVYS